jgi:hypothetical protein
MTRLIRNLAALAPLLAAAGCGGTVDVSGKVTYQGKPVVFGTVVLIGPDGVPKSGPIKPDGTFRVDGVKVGTAKVAVSSPPPPGAQTARKPRGGREGDDKPPPDEAPADPEVIRNWVALPEKYTHPAQSGLTADVQSGRPLELELK